MTDVLNWIWNNVGPHWPGIAWALFVLVSGQIAKAALWTEERAKPGAPGSKWWALGRSTLALHPALLGIGIGILPGMPASPAVVTVAAKCLYFAAIGACTAWAFRVAQKFIEWKWGVKIPNPTESEPPPPPPKPPTYAGPTGAAA